MSLIDDALRKTRREAAERDSDRTGVLFSAKIADRPSRSGLGLGLVLGALIAVLATVAGGAAVWWVLDGAGTQEPSPAQAASVTVTDPVSVSVSAPDDSDSGPGQQQASADSDQRPATSAATEPATAADTSTEAASDSDTATATDTATDTATVTATDTATDTDTASAPATGFVGKEDGIDIYLMEADLGDVTLSLDFLVFRPTDPYAEINGTEIHVGGTVAGFRVKSVERDRVVLSDGRRTLVLRAP